IRGVESEKILPLVSALYDGGIRIVEVTFPQGEDDRKTFESIKLIKDNFQDKIHVGSGTVLTKKQVILTKKAGGEFVISPDTYKKIIKKTRKLNMISIPGAFTPTEIMKAVRLKADFVKVFPASSLGVEYIKAIRVPLSKVKLLVASGVNLENIKDYLEIGVSGFGLSSTIINKEMLEKDDFNGIRDLAKKYVDLIKQ
ncbi:MAG: bifunctional 4-hydroxy-2-oxoglutarate aldolase/2-dehydro-3-deoxy-phosphogluconate aldolase, partial [Firmicutes bacterium]|nr:bifunctional 4-hydroxy-2-oxoglutarate aldolase/2-dehydro-3-deoxy-phosphogluconate aldolase [Candidatus Caballimonas caccae]